MTAFLLATMLFVGEREDQSEGPAPATGKPTLELDPPQVMVGPGEPFRLKAKTNASKVFFDTEGVRMVPDEWPLNDRKTCFYGIAPSANGTHTITVTVFVGEERLIRKVLVFVGQNPVPPVPPGPAPADPFTAELQPLFTADKGTADQRDKICELWKSAAAHVDSNPEFTTMREFTEAMHATSKKFPFNLSDEALPTIRKKMAVELTVVCGPGATELGAPKSECRKKAAALLNRYAVALGGVK